LTLLTGYLAFKTSDIANLQYLILILIVSDFDPY
jgi:hypothetical protein